MDFIDLKAQQRVISKNIRNNVDKVLKHGSYIMGPEVFELEERLEKYSGMKYCISCSNGTDALLMALMAKGVKTGDAIFTTPFTFVATAEVIILLGVTPVFVDIDEKTFNLDTKKLEELVKNFSMSGVKPKGIIAVDLYGQAADYDEINRIALENDLFVIEDGAQSFGGTYVGRKNCSLAEIASTSFFPSKPLGAYGDGGAIFTNDSSVSDILESIRIHGKGVDKYDNIRVGLNARLDTIQAAILLAKFDVFDEEMNKRREIAKLYNELLAKIVEIPFILDKSTSAWALYTIRSEKRDQIMKGLKEESIPFSVYYPTPLHLQKAFEFLGYRKGSFPVAEKASETVLSLPFHPYMSEKDVEKVSEIIKRVVNS